MDVAGPQVASGWFTGQATVTVEGDDGVQFEFSVDGAAFAPYSGPFPVSGEGIHIVEVRGSDGSEAAQIVPIDTTPPAAGTIIAPLDVVSINTVVGASAGFSDLGAIGTYTAQWSWGDGLTSPGAVVENDGSGTVTGSHTYSLPDVYVITLTVTDAAGRGDESVFHLVVVSAADLKQGALDALAIHIDESKRIEKAVAGLLRSRALDAWLDETHLDPKDGKKVFDRERQAVHELMKAIEDTEAGRKGALSTEALAAVVAGIDGVVAADRLLASILLDELDGLTAADPGRQAEVDLELSRALDELLAGDTARDAGDFDKALEHYRKAWEHAQKAAKEAASSGR